MKRCLLVILLLFVLSFAAPVYGQEATPDVTPIVAPDAPVDAGDTTVIVETPAPLIDNSTIIAIGALLVAIVAVFRATRGGKTIDEAATMQLELIRANRDAMAAYERQYTQTNATVRQAFDAFTDVLRVIAPLTTGIKADDELSKTLDDVRTPGAPPAPSALSQPKRED